MRLDLITIIPKQSVHTNYSYLILNEIGKLNNHVDGIRLLVITDIKNFSAFLFKKSLKNKSTVSVRKLDLKDNDHLIRVLSDNRGVFLIKDHKIWQEKVFFKSFFNSGYYLSIFQNLLLCGYQAGCFVTQDLLRVYRELKNEAWDKDRAPFFNWIEPPVSRIPSPEKIELGFGAQIYARSYISSDSTVNIGRCSLVNVECEFNMGPGKLEVGNFTMISTYCNIMGARHTLSHISTFYLGTSPYAFINEAYDKKGDVIIGSDVWVGSHVKILPGVRIGDGAVIGTGSVVTKDVLPYAVMAGAPARLIKMRFSKKVINKFLEVKWWNLPGEILKERKGLFRVDLNAKSEKRQIRAIEELAKQES